MQEQNKHKTTFDRQLLKTTHVVYHRDLREKLRPFARLHSPDEHEMFVQGLLSKIYVCPSLIYREIFITYHWLLHSYNSLLLDITNGQDNKWQKQEKQDKTDQEIEVKNSIE